MTTNWPTSVSVSVNATPLSIERVSILFAITFEGSKVFFAYDQFSLRVRLQDALTHFLEFEPETVHIQLFY